MSVAIVQLVMSTPVHPEATLGSVSDNLRQNAELAGERARVIDNLASRGFALVKVVANASDTDTYDVVVYMARNFHYEADLVSEARICGCREALNFSYLWNWDGTFDANGYPNYEWGGECA